MPTVEALHDALLARTGSVEPSAAELAALGPDGEALARALREVAAAGKGLPLLFGTVRRVALVAWDATTTAWDAWDTATGERRLLRLPRRRDAATLARLRADAEQPGVLPMEWSEEGVPHLRSVPFDGTLADLLPLADPPGAAWIGRVLAGVLRSLGALHAAGRAHGQLGPALVMDRGGAWEVAWLDPDEGGGAASVADDLRAFGHLAVAVDPAGDLGRLAEGFAEHPPPSAEDAARLLVAGLGAQLAEAHHHVVLRARRMERARRTALLRRLVRRLIAAVPPPVVRGCLRAEADGRAFVVASDGLVVRAGAWAHGGALERLPAVWVRGLLEPGHARAAMRAWSGRAAGDEDARRARNADLGGDDADLERLARWLAGMARLRADAMVLDAKRT